MTKNLNHLDVLFGKKGDDAWQTDIDAMVSGINSQKKDTKLD